MRLLWAKWANIPRIIISNLARTWGTEKSSSEQTALRSSAGRSLNEYSSVKPLMDLLQLSQLQGSSGCLPENLPVKKKKARPPRSFPPDPWNCCHLSVPPRIARIWIGSGQRLKDLHSARSLCLSEEALVKGLYIKACGRKKSLESIFHQRINSPQQAEGKRKKKDSRKKWVLNGYF